MNKLNLKMKLYVSQQPLELRQNHLHLCVHQVVEIIRKIVIFRFEQLRDLIFLKKQHFSQSLPRGELRAIRRFALAHTVAEICTTSFVNFVILICMLKVIKFDTKST